MLTVPSLAIKDSASTDTAEKVVTSCLDLLSNLSAPPERDADIETFFAEPPQKPTHAVRTLSSHKKKAQQAWLTTLASSLLTKEQRKSTLGMMVHRIVPWFTKVERLMDFLTDWYNVGGSTSLLALSGLFYLMQEKNLDYPSFYTKLYSLLDEGLLHSKHRSRFFRLLETFMTSTHLPAALVASFIKRLSRLALHAPPAGIVVVVPWIYNMFKLHPQCTFMIHRELRTAEQKAEWTEHGFRDPFDMAATDPLETGAIESSLWEIETLQSHYHPNVATLAKIISEQFTKQQYNLEDFLDHSYTSVSFHELSQTLRTLFNVCYS
jgi:U3 small nucleolar RNA-associated protein 19